MLVARWFSSQIAGSEPLDAGAAIVLVVEIPRGVHALLPERTFPRVGNLGVGELVSDAYVAFNGLQAQSRDISAALVLACLSRADLRGVTDEMDKILAAP